MTKIMTIISILAGISLCVNIPSAPAQNFANLYQEDSAPEDTTTNNSQGHNLTLPNQENLLKEPLGENGLTDAQVDAAAIDALRSTSKYTLGPDDVIEVTVLRHPEFGGQFLVNQEGKIQYEHIGDIKVAGLTKEEVRDFMTKQLSEFIISPEVSVKISGYNSKVVYVLGEVNAPGKIYMRGDTITVHEALVQAGLPLLSASTKKCRLITPDITGKATIKYVNVFSLLYEGDLRENLTMKQGDTLYIPATVLAKAMRILQPVSQPINDSTGTAAAVAGAPGF